MNRRVCNLNILAAAMLCWSAGGCSDALPSASSSSPGIPTRVEADVVPLTAPSTGGDAVDATTTADAPTDGVDATSGGDTTAPVDLDATSDASDGGVATDGGDATDGMDAGDADSSMDTMDASVDVDVADPPVRTPECVDAVGLEPMRTSPCAAPDLVGCWTFDGDIDNGGDWTLIDGSAKGLDGSATGVTYGQGPDGSALELDGGASLAQVPLDADRIAATGFDFWVRVDAAPSSGRVGLLDYDGGYSAFLFADGQLRVSCGDTFLYTAFTTGRWTHVFCTHDGTTQTLWLDGDAVAMEATGLPSNNAAETAIGLGRNQPSGDNLTGALDSVRLWRSTPDAQGVCSSAVKWD